MQGAELSRNLKADVERSEQNRKTDIDRFQSSPLSAEQSRKADVERSVQIRKTDVECLEKSLLHAEQSRRA